MRVALIHFSPLHWEAIVEHIAFGITVCLSDRFDEFFLIKLK
jgi:hypothetical protein